MQINVQGKNGEIPAEIREYVGKKVQKLGRFYQRILSADVELSDEKPGFRAQVTLKVPGNIIRAEEIGEGAFQVIDGLMEKLQRQVKRYKTLKEDKPRKAGEPLNVASAGGAGQESSAQATPHIVRRKLLELKPMSPDEAILQMELLGHSFFVFINSEDLQTSVLYRRNDGNYGLITAA